MAQGRRYRAIEDAGADNPPVKTCNESILPSIQFPWFMTVRASRNS